MLPLVLGAVVGIILSVLNFNNIMAMMIGVREATFAIPHFWLIGASIGLMVVSYAIILIITRRIRKISPCELVR